MKGSKVTKRVIDDACEKYLAMADAKAKFQKAEKAYLQAITPVIKYVEEELHLPPDKGAELRGAISLLELGQQRKIRFITDTVEALRRLEHREQGLGYANISIPLKALEENLAARDYEDLLEVKYGKRSVKATRLD
jgi:hypothetical protein